MDNTGQFEGSLFAVAFSFIGCLTLLMTRNHRRTLPFQIRIFLISLWVRFAFSTLVYSGGLVTILKDEDGSAWSAGADIAQRWATEGLTVVDIPGEFYRVTSGARTRHLGYFYMLASLFFVTEAPYRMVAAALNCTFGALTVVLTFRIAEGLFSDRVARVASWYTCLFPSLVTWSSFTIKEPVVIFLESLALYCCLSFRTGGRSVRHLATCLVTTILLLPFRFYAAYIVSLTVLFGLTLPDTPSIKRLVRNTTIVFGLILLCVLTGSIEITSSEYEMANMDRVEHFRHSVSVGNLGTGSGVETNDVRSVSGLAVGLMIGGSHLMLAPFPWELGGASLRMALTLPELLVWWWLFFRGFLPGLVSALRRQPRPMMIFLVYLSGFALLYSLMFGNIGLIFRQRAQLLPWLLIISSVGLVDRSSRRTASSRGSRPIPLGPSPEAWMPPSGHDRPGGAWDGPRRDFPPDRPANEPRTLPGHGPRGGPP